MKGRRYIFPHGAITRMSKDLGISDCTIRNVCKGKIKGYASEDTAKLIYAKAPAYGGMRQRG